MSKEGEKAWKRRGKQEGGNKGGTFKKEEGRKEGEEGKKGGKGFEKSNVIKGKKKEEQRSQRGRRERRGVSTLCVSTDFVVWNPRKIPARKTLSPPCVVQMGKLRSYQGHTAIPLHDSGVGLRISRGFESHVCVTKLQEKRQEYDRK